MEGLVIPLIMVNIAFTGLLGTLTARQTGRINALDSRMDSLDTKIDARFDALTGRLDGLNSRVDTVLTELAGLSERVARLETQR